MSITELLALIKQIRGDGKGVTAMEYGVIAAAVIVAIATTVTTLGKRISNTFTTVASNLSP